MFEEFFCKFSYEEQQHSISDIGTKIPRRPDTGIYFSHCLSDMAHSSLHRVQHEYQREGRAPPQAIQGTTEQGA